MDWVPPRLCVSAVHSGCETGAITNVPAALGEERYIGEDIVYSDIPELNEDFWRRAERHMPTPKKGVFIRLDADVLDCLKSKGKGYQTRMNAMLRALRTAGCRILSALLDRRYTISSPLRRIFATRAGIASENQTLRRMKLLQR